MKSKFFSVWVLAFLLVACSGSSAEDEKNNGEQPPVVPAFKEMQIADFETEDTTPYFFRFGNRGSAKEYDYKPRWIYSHAVVDNPAKDGSNSSSRVLKYSSMEARDYGIKFLFANPVAIDEIGSVQLTVFQPKNVLDKPVLGGGMSAREQQICVKLLSGFNTINDFRQDEGILLSAQAQSFTEENEWVLYSFQFNKADYNGQLSKFKNGVVGIALLPTYKAGVTLLEESPYLCYVDNIILNSGK